MSKYLLFHYHFYCINYKKNLDLTKNIIEIDLNFAVIQDLLKEVYPLYYYF